MSSSFRQKITQPPLGDDIIDEINQMFDWHAAAELPDGRLLGRIKPGGKRPVPNAIPDRRIQKLNDYVDLSDKSVLEIGCFEGIHTTGLGMFSPNVTGIDVRPVNVMKTLARLSLHGVDAQAFIADCEKIRAGFGSFDVVFHFGVLYHLMHPVEHIKGLGEICEYLYLDTHFTLDTIVDTTIEVDGASYHGKSIDEGGWKDPYSGKDAKAIHLTAGSLLLALEHAGFANRRIVQIRDERNGPRILILASKTRTIDHVPSKTLAETQFR
jgi:SAM-dependent methyltransferase